jgi:hypothetical protein
MYDVDFSGLLWIGIFFGVLLTCVVIGAYELLDWLIDVTIEFNAW